MRSAAQANSVRVGSLGPDRSREEVSEMAMAAPRRNDRARRSAPSGVVMRNEAGTHEVEVSRALAQWAVTVTSLADSRMICQDFFNRRWEAMARAEDFLRLLNRKEPPPGW
jgi:hypothetical protein